MYPQLSAHNNYKSFSLFFHSTWEYFTICVSILTKPPVRQRIYLHVIIPKLSWKKLLCVAVCLPKTYWIKLPSWPNYTITLNQTVFSRGAFQPALSPPLCFSYLFSTFSYINFSVSLSVVIFFPPLSLPFIFTSLISFCLSFTLCANLYISYVCVCTLCVYFIPFSCLIIFPHFSLFFTLSSHRRLR